MTTKSATAYRTISEAAEEIGVPWHVLRYWEGEFTGIRPLRRGGGRRFYRPEDMAIFRRIYELRYVECFTMWGAKRALKAERKKRGHRS